MAQITLTMVVRGTGRAHTLISCCSCCLSVEIGQAMALIGGLNVMNWVAWSHTCPLVPPQKTAAPFENAFHIYRVEACIMTACFCLFLDLYIYANATLVWISTSQMKSISKSEMTNWGWIIHRRMRFKDYMLIKNKNQSLCPALISECHRQPCSILNFLPNLFVLHQSKILITSPSHGKVFFSSCFYFTFFFKPLIAEPLFLKHHKIHLDFFFSLCLPGASIRFKASVLEPHAPNRLSA